jgi:hypothetical protein
VTSLGSHFELLLTLTLVSQIVMFLTAEIQSSLKRDCDIMAYLSLYLIRPDRGCLEDVVPYGDSLNYHNLLLTKERL